MSEIQSKRRRQRRTTEDFIERASADDPRFGAILTIANALSTRLTSDELLQVIMEQLTRLLDAERSTLFLRSDQGGELWSKVSLGNRREEIRVAIGEGLSGWVAATGRTVNVKDAYLDPRFDARWDERIGYRTTSMICQPVTDRDGELIGVAQVLNKRAGYFSVEDEMMLRTIMALAAISIVNTNLYNALLSRQIEVTDARQRVEAKLREIDLLYMIERDLNDASDLDTVIAQLLDRIMSAVPVVAAQIALRTPVGGMVIHRLAGADALEVRPVDTPVGLSGQVIATGLPLDLSTLKPKQRDRLAAEEGLEGLAGSGLLLPIEIDGRPVGALGVFGRASGATRWDEADGQVIALIGQQVSRAIGGRLERDRVEREDRLSLIGRTLAGILHDFKTPMTIASGYVQMMENTEDPKRRAELSRSVQTQLERVTQMSGEVLAFARGESDLFVRKVLMNHFADEAAELMGEIFRDTGVEVAVEAGYRGIALIDSIKLLRVVQNLARNARDAMIDADTGTGAGRVSLSISQCTDDGADDLLLTFADSGGGVPTEFRHRMFEAFATSGKKGGTGLGLAMVRQFAAAHGGQVTYRDTPGGGATFALRIRRDIGSTGRRPALDEADPHGTPAPS